MSKTIDERVVSMQFDNKNFESNVRTTMSTLEKLKARLNLSGASKGLESVNAAANKCNLSPMGSAVDSVRVKFSTLQVAALTCLQNITNQAFNTGKSILSSLTIQPITTGFNEYELKMNSIQTIMASTGQSLATVNEYLNELNKYSDETIYSFSDMTQNIGKFTNAGIKLEDAVTAIKGIANEAALSGANANEAARAMYNFSQALSTGYVQRIDWKSIELANMATVEFKEQLLEQAVAMGTVTKNAEGLYAALGDDNFYNTSQMFIEALDEQWLTSEVLIETLKDYADETTDIGARATKAATEVKTFSHMMDTLRESAQSGWAQTWETILGDFNEGKSLWTSLNNVIGGWISKSADKRNTMLADVLNSNWEKLIIKINDAGHETSVFEDHLKSALRAGGHDVDALLRDYESLEEVFTSGAVGSDVLKDAIKALNGEVDNVGEKLFDLSGIDKILGFGAVGDDVKKVQDALEKLGYTLDRFGVDGIIGAETTAAIKQFQSDNGLTADGIIGEETLAALEKAAEVTGELTEENKGLVESYEDLVDAIDKARGRELVIESFVKIFEKFKPVIEGFKATWDKVFGDFPSVGEVLTIVIDKFANFADELVINEDKIQSMTKTFEGLLTVLKMVALLSGGATGYIFKLFNMVANELDVDFFNMTETIAEIIIQFYNWITTNNVLYKSVVDLGNAVIDFATSTIRTVREWIDNFLSLSYVTEQIDALSESFGGLLRNISGWLGNFGSLFSAFFSSLLDMDSITFDGIISAVGELVTGIFGQIREVISGLDTPFTNFVDLIITFFAELGNGEGTVEKFTDNFNKIKDAVNKVIKPIGGFINKLLEWGDAFGSWISSLKDVEDIPTAIGEGLGKVIGGVFKYILDALSQLGRDIWAGMTGVGGDGVAGLVNGLINGVSTIASAIWTIGTTMIETICSVLGIASPSKVMMAIGMFAILGLAIGLQQAAPEVWGAIVSFGTELLSKFKTVFIAVLEWISNLNIGQIISVAVTGGMLAFAISIVKIGMRIADALADVTEGVASVTKGAGKILGNIGNIFGEMAKNQKAKRFQIYAEAIKSLAIAIGVLVASIAILTLVADEGEMWSAVGAIVAILAAFAAFAAVVALAERIGKISALKFGAMALGMTGIAIGIAIVAAAAKNLSEVPSEDLLGVTAAIATFIIGLGTVVTAYGALAKGKVAKNIDKVGSVILRFGAAMLMMSYAAKIIGSLDAGQVERGRNAVLAFGGIVGALVLVTAVAGGKIKAIGNMILKIGGIFLLMGYVLKLMSSLTQAEIDRGVSAIQSFAGIVLATVLLMRLISLIPSKGGAKSGSGSNLNAIGSTILQVAGALFVIAGAAMMLGSMKPDELKQAGNAVVGLVAVIGVLLAGLNAINAGNLKDVGSTILMVAGSILVIAAAAKIIGGMQWQELLAATLAIGAFGTGIYFMIQMLGKVKAKSLAGVGMTLLLAAGAIAILATIASVIGLIELPNLAKGVIAVGLLGALMVGLVKATAKSKDAKSTLIGVAIAMGVLAAAVVALSFLDPWTLMESVAGIGILMLVLTETIQRIGSSKVKVKPLIAIAGVMAVLGGILFLIGQLDPWRAIEAAASLSLAMLAMAGAMAIINKFGSTSGAKKGPQTLKLLSVMAAVALAVSAAISIIGQLDPGAIWNAVGALSATMLVMSLLTVMMNKMGSGGSVGSLLAMSVALLAIGASMTMLAAIPADQLWSVFGALAASMTVLTIVVVALAAAFTAFAPGAALVVGVLLSIALVAVAVGAAAIMFAAALSIVSGILPELATGLTMLITSLAGCSDSAWAFIGVCAALLVGLTLVTAGLAILSVGVVVAAAAMLVGVTLLSAGLVILSVGLIVASVGLVALSVGLLLAGAGVYVFAGGLMFAAAACEAVGAALPAIAEGFAGLIETLAGCSDSAWAFVGVSAALLVGIVLLTAAAAVFTVGAAFMAVGLTVLSVGLVIASAAIVIFSGALIIGAAAVYIMAGAISFLGTCITEGLAAGIAAGIETVTAAVSSLAGSVIGTICSVLGINSPSVVMQGLGRFTGQGFALGISESKGEVSSASADLASAAKEGLGTAGTEGGDAFNSEALSNMDLNSLLSGSGIDTSAITGLFGNAGTESGDAFNMKALESMDFSSLLSGSGMDTSALTGAFGDLGIESGTAFSTSASETASMQPTLDAMLGEISGSTPKFNAAGNNVIKAFAEGIASASAAATSKLSSTVKTMASVLKGGYSNFYSAGRYLVIGFASGITNNAWYARNAAVNLALLAYEAAKKTLDINSPSKLFRSLGSSVPEGFAQGIGMYGGLISDSIDTMAGTAIDETRNVIANITDVVNSDIDSQPTIRPVLDLSDVSSGISSMNGMFGMSPSVRVMSNVGAISSMMNGRQNGGNTDVISAINDLGRQLGNVRGDTYQINGVNVGGDAEVENAFKVIVKAAQVGRRR